jgi:hypothetical protein
LVILVCLIIGVVAVLDSAIKKLSDFSIWGWATEGMTGDSWRPILRVTGLLLLFVSISAPKTIMASVNVPLVWGWMLFSGLGYLLMMVLVVSLLALAFLEWLGGRKG